MACLVCKLVLYPGVQHIRLKKKKEIKIKQRATIGMYPHPRSISTQKSFFWKTELEQDVFDAS